RRWTQAWISEDCWSSSLAHTQVALPTTGTMIARAMAVRCPIEPPDQGVSCLRASTSLKTGSSGGGRLRPRLRPERQELPFAPGPGRWGRVVAPGVAQERRHARD